MGFSPRPLPTRKSSCHDHDVASPLEGGSELPCTLPEGDGWIIDTPGIRSFGMSDRFAA